jgi:hypothetical protein
MNAADQPRPVVQQAPAKDAPVTSTVTTLPDDGVIDSRMRELSPAVVTGHTLGTTALTHVNTACGWVTTRRSLSSR